MLKKLLKKLIGSKKPSRKPAVPKPASRRKPAKPAKKKPVSPRKKISLKAAPSKGAAAEGNPIGEVIGFFRIPMVAVFKLTKGKLRLGDRIWVRGHTTNLKETLSSMQINHQPIQEAKKGDEIGVKISARARRGDRVYLLSA